MAEHVHAPPRVARLDPAPPRWIHGMLQDAWHWCKPWHWFRIHGIGASPRVAGLDPAPPSRVTRTNGIGSDYTKPYVGIPEGNCAAIPRLSFNPDRTPAVAKHVLAPPRVAGTCCEVTTVIPHGVKCVKSLRPSHLGLYSLGMQPRVGGCPCASARCLPRSCAPQSWFLGYKSWL